MKAVVEKRLSAAGLLLWKDDRAAEVLEDLGDGDSDLRIELVGEASDEQGGGRHDG